MATLPPPHSPTPNKSNTTRGNPTFTLEKSPTSVTVSVSPPGQRESMTPCHSRIIQTKCGSCMAIFKSTADWSVCRAAGAWAGSCTLSHAILRCANPSSSLSLGLAYMFLPDGSDVWFHQCAVTDAESQKYAWFPHRHVSDPLQEFPDGPVHDLIMAFSQISKLHPALKHTVAQDRREPGGS